MGKIRKVLIGTPCYDGRIDVWYANSVRRTEQLLAKHCIESSVVYLSYDALVQRARNDLVRIAKEGGFDDLLFIDSDMEWEPEWVLALLNHDVDVVGAAYRKKTDEMEMYTVKASLPMPVDMKTGLWIVDGIGTGFLRLSRLALKLLWDASEEYENEGRKCRWIFDVCVLNHRLVSEDNIMCEKLRQLGVNVHLDPSFTPTHIGTKKYQGNFQSYVAALMDKQAISKMAS